MIIFVCVLDHALPESGGLVPIIGGVAVGLVLVVVGVLLVVLRKHIFGRCNILLLSSFNIKTPEEANMFCLIFCKGNASNI